MVKARINRSPIIMLILVLILILNGIFPAITVVNAEVNKANIASPYNIYFGDLHRHTTHSDGWEDIYDILGGTANYAQDEKNAGRDVNIDFLAITDHNVSLNMNEYREIKTAVNYFNNLYGSEFLGIAGMENNYDGGRHINTFGNDINEVGWRLGGGWPYPNFHDFVDENNLIGQFNHPTDENDHYDFQMFQDVKDNMCLVETACVNDSVDGAYEWKYTLALDKGWRVAPTVNSDHSFEHDDPANGNGGILGRWTKEARTAILATSLTRDAFYEAMRARRVYATLDKNLEINYTVNGYPMGSEIMAKANGTVDINLKIKDGDATTRIESVQLYTNTGEVFYTFDLTGHNSNIEDLSVTLPIFGFHDTNTRYLYAKVIVQDEANERRAAWTAPVWIQATPEYKNEAFNKPVTSSNNVYKENIVDGNPATYWSSNLHGENEWVTIDLQERKDIIGFKLYMLTQASIVNHFKVQASNNGSEWTTLYDTSEHGPNLEGGILEVHFAPINYRYFRMQSTTINEPWGYVINEFKVFSQGTLPDSAPPSVNFAFDGQSPGSNQVNYVIYGNPTPGSLGNYHIVVDDPDVALENNKITRVEVRRVNENQSETVVKTYNTNSHHVEINGDILSLMNPNYPDGYDFNMSQTFKIVAYQGAAMMSYYVSNNIGVNIIRNAEPYFTILPFNMDPYYVDPYDPWGDYPVPTAVYNCPYAINQIADQNKIPKFKIKINDRDNNESDKIVLLQVLKLNNNGAGHTIVKEIHYNESEQRTMLSIEVPTAECMGNDINAQFVVRVTNKAGMVFTSTPIGAIWNIIDTEPWIRFDVIDVPSPATYEAQKLSYIGDRNAVKNANPKFHIELEGNYIINKVEIVDFNDVPIWTKDISLLNTTAFNYDVNLLPLITPFSYYRVKATASNGIGYYSKHIKTDWLTWSTSTAPIPLQVKGYPSGLESVTVYSDEAPCFKINYTWYGTSQTEVNRINIKDSAGTIVNTLNIDGTVSRSYEVPIEGLMGGASNKSFYAEFVYKNGGGSYKTGNVNITYINKPQPVISFRPFNINPVNSVAEYTSNYFPNQIPEETRPKFHIEVSGTAASYKDNIQRVELVDANNNVIKAVDVSNQNSCNIVLDWDTLECLGQGLSGTYKIRAINKDCRVFESQWVQAVWSCTNTADVSFTADGHGTGSTITIEGSPEEIAQAGTGIFNINIQETDSHELFNITQIDIVKADGEVAKTLNVNSRSINTQVNITECMEEGTNESFHLIAKNAAGQEFTTGSITVNWVYNHRSIVSFAIAQYPTVVQKYYLGSPNEQQGGRPSFHISVNDPDSNGDEIVTLVEIKRKRDNKTVKSYDVAAQNSRSFDVAVDIFQLLNYSVYECYYVTVTYSGQQKTNSREIHVCWNQPPELEISSELQNENGEIIINSGYTPQEAEQLGISPEFSVIVYGIDSFYENIIQRIEIVNAAGEVVDFRDYNDFIYSIEENFSIAKCLGNSTNGELYARVTLYDGNTYTTSQRLNISWFTDHAPVINFSIYGRTEGTTVFIPRVPLPGKEPKISVRAADVDNTDNDIISKVEILTTNGEVLKTFNVLEQNSNSISINEEVAQYVEKEYNYFYIRVTNKGGKVYTTGGIYVYYGDLSEPEIE